MTNEELGVYLARKLFACGDGPKTATRIEFKAGTWPHSETAQGGFNEPALAAFFAKVLNERASPSPAQPEDET